MAVRWTQAMDVALRELHMANFTFEDVAEKLGLRFGVPVSKNACIGRGARIGLPERRAQLNRVASPVRSRIDRTSRAKAPPKAANGEAPKAEKPPQPPRERTSPPRLPVDPELRREVFNARADKALDRFDAIVAASRTDDDPGVLFLDPGSLRCAMPMPGWDDLPVDQKRICGKPVTFRSDGVPTSYCPACSRIAYAPAGFQAFKDRDVGAAA